jgi:hypothetical protein
MQTILDSDVYLPSGPTVQKDSYLHDLNHGPRSAYSQVDRSVVLQNLGMFVEAGDAFGPPHIIITEIGPKIGRMYQSGL